MPAVESVLFIAIVFTVAGWLKGVTGMGCQLWRWARLAW